MKGGIYTQQKVDIEWRPIVFDEVWKPVTQDVIPYVLPYYYVSSYGRVYSAVSGRLMILTLDYDGYVYGNFHLEKGNPVSANRKFDQTTFRINRLVLATFNPVEGWRDLECNHKDSVRSNNYIENLEWVTSKENCRYGLELGYRQIQNIEGVMNPKSKLTEAQVLEIVELVKEGKMNYKDIADKYGMSETNISAIARGKLWPSLTKGIIDESFARVSRAYSNQEVKSILDFFESRKDVLNDKSVYPSLNSIIVDCLTTTGLIMNHPVEASRKTIAAYLRKQNAAASNLYANYTYHYDR